MQQARSTHWPPGASTPKRRRRSLALLRIFSLALLFAAGFLALSIWIESRFPSADPQRALLPGPQKVLTKPVVDAVGRQISHYVRERARDSIFRHTGLTLDQTITRFLDERVDLSERRLYAYRLARDGSPKAVAALLKVFHNAPPDHKAFMAQLIGTTGNPGAKEWLAPLLTDSNPRLVAAAIRGLSSVGDEEVAGQIIGILNDFHRPAAARVEAALGLGTIGTSQAREALVEALGSSPAGELEVQILNSLGQFEFPAVAQAFSQYLAAPATPPKMRVAAVESLAASSAEAVPFLMRAAAEDADPEVRASAAWALSGHESAQGLGPALVDLAEHEPAADVRRRIYEALLAQNEVVFERVLPLVSAEADLAARVAGFNALAHGIRHQFQPELAAIFDQQLVPELFRVATSTSTTNLRMRAVFALRRAQTSGAQAALRAIAGGAPGPVATAARNGLPASSI